MAIDVGMYDGFFGCMMDTLRCFIDDFARNIQLKATGNSQLVTFTGGYTLNMFYPSLAPI
jgi:hypothetical protein